MCKFFFSALVEITIFFFGGGNEQWICLYSDALCSLQSKIGRLNTGNFREVGLLWGCTCGYTACKVHMASLLVNFCYE